MLSSTDGYHVRFLKEYERISWECLNVHIFQKHFEVPTCILKPLPTFKNLTFDVLKCSCFMENSPIQNWWLLAAAFEQHSLAVIQGWRLSHTDRFVQPLGDGESSR